MILKALYFFIPAYAANMIPVFVGKVKFLDSPMDLKKTFRGKRLLGGNKTWRGAFFGIIAGIVFFEIQKFLFSKGIWTNMALIDYGAAPVFLGAVLGFATIFGDAVESFFKRQLNIIPGRPWIPFDQLDFLVFSLIISKPWSGISLRESLLILPIVFFLTMFIQYFGYLTKLKKNIL